MKKLFAIAASFLAIIMLSGCPALGGIFKADAVVGVITVVVVIAVIIWIISLFRGRT
jgi:uncharacterized membrane protein YtjA (UPF0391 family)